MQLEDGREMWQGRQPRLELPAIVHSVAALLPDRSLTARSNSAGSMNGRGVPGLAWSGCFLAAVSAAAAVAVDGCHFGHCL